MPTFEFTGRNESTGALVTGTREVASHAVLGQDLLQEGILLTSFEAKKEKKARSVVSFFLSRVPVLERVLFARYFALMLRAGLDLKSSIATLQKQTNNKSLSHALSEVYQGVERGQSLSDSMRPYPYAFPDLFVGFIRVGETTGRLQETLEILAAQLQKEFELRRAVRGGMLYPIVIITALLAVGAAMMIFVVPKLVEIFEGFNVELPLMTRILIGTSKFATNYWYIVLVVVIAVAALFWWLLRIPQAKRILLNALLYVPIIGPITKSVNIARFSRNLSSLLSSGVAFSEALSILGTNTPHPVYAEVFFQAEEYVKQGKSLSDFFGEKQRLFPPLVVNIMGVGEQTGELSAVLQEVASFYEGEVDQTMKNLTSIMEPVLMIVIGLAVGALAVSVISPIYGLVNVI
jgi:type II secretory pathway component PulF